MKSILRRRPSPALVISMIALFVSLSGVSYGVATGFIDSREIKNNEVRSLDIRNNEIRSRDIRNNEIRTRDLRNNEVRGIDIRNSTVQGRDVALNTLTGDDVKEDTLGKVPSAASADSATTAGGVSTLKIIPVTTMAEGAPPVALATHGPLMLSGECLAGSVPQVSVSTTENNSAGAGTSRFGTSATADRGFQDPDIDAADGRVKVADLAVGMTNPAYAVAAVSALAPSGKGFSGEVGMYRDSSGTGPCRFHGSLALQG